MKNKKTLTFKILAGIVALVLICFILFVTNAFVGNPISQRMANKAIKQYVDKNYAAMNLEVGKASYDFKDAAYVGIAKSKTSIDTKFGVYYRDGKVERDNYESYVLGKFNTVNRLSDEYSTIAKNIIASELGYDKNTTFVDFKNNDSKNTDDENLIEKLELDEKFDKTLFATPEVCIRLDLKDNSIDIASKILTDAHKAFVANNCNFYNYSLSIQNSSTDYVDVSGVTPADIESGNLKSLLEKAKTNRSGTGISVLIKE